MLDAQARLGSAAHRPAPASAFVGSPATASELPAWTTGRAPGDLEIKRDKVGHDNLDKQKGQTPADLEIKKGDNLDAIKQALLYVVLTMLQLAHCHRC